MFNKRASTSSLKGKGRSSSGVFQQIQHSTSSKSVNTTTTIGGESSVQEAPAVIPYTKTSENIRVLPKMFAALARSKHELVPVEDLDSIQLELETLLSNVAMRNRVLKQEYESIEKDDKRLSDRTKIRYDHLPSIGKTDKQPKSPGKRKRSLGIDDKKPKGPQFKLTKQKSALAPSPVQSSHTDDSMDAVSTTQHPPHIHLSQHSHIQGHSQLSHSAHQSHHLQPHPHLPKKDKKISLPKNDTPNKFWLSVEPYCMPLTNEDLKLLDDLLEQYSEPVVPPIPELGPHYSQVWATEDLKEEQNNSNINSKSKNCKLNSNSTDINGMLKKSEKLMGDGVTGPLTQRLVSALIDENLMVDGLSNADSNSSSENTTTNSTSTLRSLSLMKNGINIEKRMKKELIEQGLLDPDEFSKEDEVLSEIKRVVTELKAISEFNSTELKRLHSAAKVELQRLEIKRKLDTVDQEIIEMYKKVVIAKQKRRPLTREEEEEVYRLTQEQRKLSDQLESIPAPGPHYPN